MRRNLGAASLISFVMAAEVSSINTFLTRTNSSGMIEDEELSFREWNCFEHVGTSTGRKPYLCALVEMAQGWKSRAGRKPHICTTQSGRPYPMHRGSRGEEKPLNLCLLFEAYCTARKCRRKHSALLLWAFSAVLLDFRPCFAPPSLWPAGAGPAFPEFVSHFISSPLFSCKSLIRLLLISH